MIGIFLKGLNASKSTLPVTGRTIKATRNSVVQLQRPCFYLTNRDKNASP